MLDIMVTFDVPDTRTAPPPSPAIESLKTEFRITRLEPTLLNHTIDISRRVHQAGETKCAAACLNAHPKAYNDPPLAAALLPVN